jgi:hypothetical protein
VEHWSNDFDQNTIYINNIIELNTGYYQSDINHPAYTTYSLNLIILNIIKLFDSNLYFSINNFSFLNLDSYLSRVFFYSKIINTLFGVLLIYYLIKILKIYKTNTLVICGLIFILLSYSRYLELSLVLRSEILSIVFSLCSFYYATKFKKSKNQYHVFLSGFVFLSCFSKNTNYFFFYYIFILNIYLFKKNKFERNIFFLFWNFFLLFFDLYFRFI